MSDGGWIGVSTLAVAAGGLAVSLWVAWRQRAQDKLISAQLDAHDRGVRSAAYILTAVIDRARAHLSKGAPRLGHDRTQCNQLAGQLEAHAAAMPGADVLGYETARALRRVAQEPETLEDAKRLLDQLAEEVKVHPWATIAKRTTKDGTGVRLANQLEVLGLKVVARPGTRRRYTRFLLRARRGSCNFSPQRTY